LAAAPAPSAAAYKPKTPAYAGERDLLTDLAASLFETAAVTSVAAGTVASTSTSAGTPAATTTTTTTTNTSALPSASTNACSSLFPDVPEPAAQVAPSYYSESNTEELRVPTRVGKVAKASESSSKKAAPAKVASNTSSKSNGAQEADVEEDEGTGQLDSISNILTKDERKAMTDAEKTSWRAKAADLQTRRKNFHGAVTLMFDGIFSWQMYGSAEAIDEFGNTYTEYLMRCQWGSTFDNLQPWIVAHRYKEFDRLDQELKRFFPALEKNMPKLPKKDFLNKMESGVVARRRAVLEDYMSKIVQSMPTILRSDLMNNFLRINERISTIRNMLHLHHPVQLSNNASESKREEERMPVTVTPATSASNARYHDESDPFGLMSSRAATGSSGASNASASVQRGQVLDVAPPMQQEEEEVEVGADFFSSDVFSTNSYFVCYFL
ncbi:hypothetical protein EON64_04420, partial [archaeon]